MNKNLKIFVGILFSIFVLASGVFAQESSPVMIDVSCDSGLKIVAIDGVDMKKKSNVQVEEGVHTFTMYYDKISLMNETRTSTNGTLYVNSLKNHMKPIEIVELPRKIDFYNIIGILSLNFSS